MCSSDLLFARTGIPHCPVCGKEVVTQSAQEIVDILEKMPDGTRIIILAPIVRGRKGTYQTVFEEIRKTGFVHVQVDGVIYNLDDEITLDRYKIHTIEAVVDRLVIQKPQSDEEARSMRPRLTDSIETALKVGDGYVTVQDITTDPPSDHYFSEFLEIGRAHV